MDVNAFTSPFQLTKSMHRNLYPTLDPKNPDLSASGKVVIITGAGGRIESVSALQISFYRIKACCCHLIAMIMQMRLI